GDGTPAFKRALWHWINASRRDRQEAKLTEAVTKQRARDDAKRIATYCNVTWENVFEDGATEPTPPTPDKVHEFLCAVIDSDEGLSSFGDFRAWATNADNFRSVPTEGDGDLGKA